MKKKLFDKIITILVILTMVIAMIPVTSRRVEAVSTDVSNTVKVSDNNTMNSYQDVFGNNTENAGRIWTDKTVLSDDNYFNNVIKMDDEEDNFLVVLSALASNKSIKGYSHIPTDTMLVLDVSGSMQNGNTRYQAMVDAANNAIQKLLELNKHNRVGIVLYSGNHQFGNSNTGTAVLLMPLDRYTHRENKFLTYTTDGPYVKVNSNVTNSKGTTMNQTSKQVAGGTFIQNGLDKAMDQFLAVTDTEIPTGLHQAGTKRMPVFVLMSDGQPTAATPNFADVGISSIGNGGEIKYNDNDTTDKARGRSAIMGFLTQLTATYAKKKVSDHYDRSALFYTLGFGTSTDPVATSVLNPESSIDRINELWETYLSLTGTSEMELDYGTGTTHIRKNTDAVVKEFVNEYFTADSNDEFTTALNNIVNEIILQSLYYPTLVDDGQHDINGYVEFIDEIGDYMEIKDIKGILVDDKFLNDGTEFSKNFTTGGGDFGSIDNPTELGDHFIWSVKERLGISSTADARALVRLAWQHGQLSQTSNYIGWYSGADGKYKGFYHDGHTSSDVPAGAKYIVKSYGYVGTVEDGQRHSDMMYMSVRIVKEIATNKTQFIWRIPASLLPLVSYEIEINSDSLDNYTGPVTVTKTPKIPVRLVFEVGLDDEINDVNITEKVSNDYKYKNSDGTYTFYTNQWDVNVLNEDNPTEQVNTIAYFEPSKENENYYYVEDSLIYSDQSGTLYSNPDNAPTGTKYRRYVVFGAHEGSGMNTLHYHYEVISSEALAQAEKNEDNNNWYIPKGVVYKTLDDFIIDKSENKTDTLRYASYPSVEQTANDGFWADTVLGNNGKLTVTPTQGVKITKQLDDIIANTNTNFIFSFELANATNAQLDGTYRIVEEDAQGNSTTSTIKFNNGKASHTIAPNSSLYILDLPVNSTLKVSESTNSDYHLINIDGNERIKEKTFTIQDKQISNTVFENTPNTYGFVNISKEVVHPFGDDYVIPSNIEFKFQVIMLDEDGSAIANTQFKDTLDKVYTTDANGQFEVTLKHGQSISIKDVLTGTKVQVTEINIPTGFTPDDNNLEGVVEENKNTTIHFVNRYSPEKVNPVNITLVGNKNFTGRTWLQTDKFTFKLQKFDGKDYVDVATKEVTGAAALSNPSNTSFSFTEEIQSIEFTEVGKYLYRVKEVEDRIGGVTYDTLYRNFEIIVTDTDMDGKLEISDVTYTSPTVVNKVDNTYNIVTDFNNSYAPKGTQDIEIIVTKKLLNPSGADLSDSNFKFKFGLYKNGQLVSESEEVGPDEQTSFKVVYSPSDIGTHQYVLREIIPADRAPGMNYSTQQYAINVDVYDKLDGTIGAKVYDADDTDLSDNTNVIDKTITNEFVPTEAQVTLKGTKTLLGKELSNGQFGFVLTLTDAQGNTYVAENDKDGNFAFVLEYNKVGTYTYKLKEFIPADAEGNKLDGITYDTREYTVTVVVSEDNGVLVSQVTVNNAEYQDDTIKFENTYTAKPVSIEINGTKELTGKALIVDEFTFDLYTADENYNTIKLVESVKNGISDENTGSFTFTKFSDAYSENMSEFKFSSVGTYYFVVKENPTSTSDNGVYEFDDAVYKVKVVVTDDGKGQLVATTTVDGEAYTNKSIRFENSFVPDKETVTLKGNKKLQVNKGTKELKAGEFSFVLLDSQSNVIETVTNDANGNFVFKALEFTPNHVGTHVYKVKEVVPSNDLVKDGITYDDTLYTVSISVSYNANTGDVSVDTKVGDTTYSDNVIKFTNEYDVNPVEVTLSGLKGITGRPLQNAEFTFELYETDAQFNVSGDAVDTAQNNTNGVFTFETLRFDALGTYYYVVKEQTPDGLLKDGILYDASKYNVVIEVTDNGLGQLVQTTTVNGNEYKDNSITFANQYSSDSVPFEIVFKKVLEGRTLEDKEFTFELLENGTILQTAQNDEAGNVWFTFLYDEVGEHVYTVREVVPTEKYGVTYSTVEHTVTVNVKDNLKGQLVATSDYNNSNPKVFRNIYTAEPAPLVIEGNKLFEGENLPEGVVFTFALIDRKTNQTIKTTTVTGAGEFEFEFDKFTSVGTYEYKISEVFPDDADGNKKDGIKYDATVYDVTVEVTDDGKGQLHAVADFGVGVDEIVFINEYDSNPTQATIKANKQFSNHPTGNVNFEFVLVDASGNVVDNDNVTGSGDLEFTIRDLDEVGTFTYTLKEVIPTDAVNNQKDGITYDTEEYQLTVKVVDNGLGQLVATTYLNDVVYDDSIVFTNEYNAKPVKLNLDINGTKVVQTSIDSYSLQGGEFEFTLTPSAINPAVVEGIQSTVRNDATGKIEFISEDVEFTQRGTYVYTVKEVSNGLPGFEYDESEFTITIEVTDDGLGQLHAFVTINGEAYANNSISFTNEYTSNSVSHQIVFEKVLEGRDLINEEFIFDLYENGQVIKTAKNNANGKVVFDFLYEEEGNHTYTVKERIPNEKLGVEYDPTTYTVYVEVKDNREGQLVVTSDYNNNEPKVFTNTYTAQPATLTISGNKEFTGHETGNVDFSFELVDSTGKQVDIVTITGSKEFVLEFDEFHTAGTYNYQVREIIPEETKGITYDTKIYNVRVEVVDNLEGQLVATAYVENGEAISFTNTYEAQPTTLKIPGYKYFTGHKYPEDVVFTFALLDAETEQQIQTVTVNGEGAFEFDLGRFTQEVTRNYKIKEIIPDETKGITYDTDVYNVRVEVVDNLEGQLVATAYVGEAEVTEETIVFENTYTAQPTTLTIPGYKVFTGHKYPENVVFTFALLDAETEAQIQTVTVNGEGAFEFDLGQFTQEVTRNYKIKEIIPEETKGIDYDTDVYNVRVEVVDNLEGQLVATAYVGDAEVTEETIRFKNTYTAQPTTLTIPGYKVFTGHKHPENVVFTFALLDAETEQQIQTVTVNGEGEFEFDLGQFTQEVTRNYKVKEIIPEELKGITYDTTVYDVRVEVVDNLEGQLVATAYIGEEEVNGESIRFENSYAPASTELTFSATKEFMNHPTKDVDFTFELVDADGEVIDSVTINGDGTLVFEIPDLEEEGEFEYTLREVIPEGGIKDGITYDATEYQLTVKVVDDEEGQLVAEIYLDGEVYESTIVFENVYEAKPAQLTTDIIGKKLVESLNSNFVMRGGEFEFTLTPSVNNPMIIEELDLTVTNDETGKVVFISKDVEFTQAGTYVYTVNEVSNGLAGFVYDEAEFTITIEVTDDGLGQLHATVTVDENEYSDELIEFTNTYDSGKTSIMLAVTKKLVGATLKEGQFKFVLSAIDNAPLPETQVVTNSIETLNNVKFDSIEFNQAGVYKYAISEVKLNEKGYTYDEKVINVTVTVTDEGGLLKAEAVYENGTEFVNTYKEEPKPAPSTSDNTNIMSYVIAMLLSFAFFRKLWRKELFGK